MNLLEQRGGELRRQHALLTGELEAWRQRVEKPAFEKHRSQVTRIADRLQGYLDHTLPPPPGATVDWAELAKLAVPAAGRGPGLGLLP